MCAHVSLDPAERSAPRIVCRPFSESGISVHRRCLTNPSEGAVSQPFRYRLLLDYTSLLRADTGVGFLCD